MHKYLKVSMSCDRNMHLLIASLMYQLQTLSKEMEEREDKVTGHNVNGGEPRLISREQIKLALWGWQHSSYINASTEFRSDNGGGCSSPNCFNLFPTYNICLRTDGDKPAFYCFKFCSIRQSTFLTSETHYADLRRYSTSATVRMRVRTYACWVDVSICACK